MHVFGIDVGTQSLKVIAVDAGLQILGEASWPYATHRPGPDAAEQDPADWEAALGPAIAELVAQVGAPAAIAIGAQLDGCIAVDAAGEPLHRALIWQDRRATAHVRVADRVFALAGQVADPSHLAAKAAYLRAAGVAAARWHQPTSYLVERLAGVAAIDHSLASTTMLYDLHARAWSPELCAAYGIAPSELPAILDTCAIAGTLSARGAALTGLAAGTPVATGTGDDFATPLGAGIVAPGSVVCAIGTAEVVGAISSTLVLDRAAAEPMVETHAYPSGGYFVENPGWLSGGALRWAIELLGLAGDRALDELAASVPDAAGVTFVPALAGAMTPVWRPFATATFHGLTARHTRAHVAHALLEGLAFGCRDVVDRLRALGLAPTEVVVLGGGARSQIWAQIRADVLGLPHRLASPSHSCALGAAAIALVAAGAYPELAAAARRIPPATTVIQPTASRDAAYRRYRLLADTLAPLAMAPWT